MENSNNNSFEIVIGEDKINQRIDKVLSSHPLIGSRSKAAQLIDKDKVKLIDSSGREKIIKSSYQTQSGDKFLISLPQERVETGLTPLELTLEILFEDKDLLLLDVFCGGASIMYQHYILGKFDLSPQQAGKTLYQMFPDVFKISW